MSLSDIRKSILEEEVRFPSNIASKISPQAIDLVKQMLNKNNTTRIKMH